MADKTLFITAFHSFISKNILNTDVFEIIKTKSNLKIVILVPDIKKDFFTQTYNLPHVTIEGVPMSAIAARPIARRYSVLSHLLLRSHYLWYKKVERLYGNRTLKGYIKYAGEILFTKLFGNLHIARQIFRRHFLKAVHIPEIAHIFDKYKPDILFSTDVFDETDVLVNREARIRHVPIIGMVRSWDNCYSKGVLRIVPEVLVVNTEELKKEAMTLHDVPTESIFVGGLPQFDASINYQPQDRKTFFRSVGLDPDKKLILFAPAGSILSDTDWQIAEILQKAITEKRIKYPAQVFVRNHPNHPADFSKFKNDGSFIFETPGKTFTQNLKDTELTKNDTEHLRNLLAHSDVILYIATTLGIDSLPFDRPQMIISFDGYAKKPYTLSVRRYYNEDHMKKMIDLHGVHRAVSADSMLDAINAYLEDPALDREGRQEMIKQQLYKLDGKSGQRIGNFVSEKIDELLRV